MKSLTDRIRMAIEQLRAEIQFHKGIGSIGMSRLHRALLFDEYSDSDYAAAVELAHKVLDGTEQPQSFSIRHIVVDQLMDHALAARIVEYDRLRKERLSSLGSIRTRHVLGLMEL